MDCVFCRIVSGQETADVIFEDDDMLAFLDLAPVHPGHLLLIPKQHYPSIVVAPESLLEKLMVQATRLAAAAMKAVKADGFNLLLANGTCAGQIIRHAHIAIIPRTPLDGIALPPVGGAAPGLDPSTDLVEKIKKKLSK